MSEPTREELADEFGFQPAPTQWDLGALKKNLTELVPQWIKEYTGESRLPFPTRIVENSTQEDVDFLAEICNLSESQHYSYWSHIYHSVNEIFVKQGKHKTAETVLDGLMATCGNVPLTAPFLLAANAYWIEQGFVPDLKHVKKANEVVKSRVARWAKYQKDFHDLQSESTTIEKIGILAQELEQEIQRAIDFEREGSASALFIKFAQEHLPLPKRSNARPEAIYQLAEGIDTWLDRKDGGQGQALKVGHKILGFWGISVTDEAARQRKHRRKRSVT